MLLLAGAPYLKFLPGFRKLFPGIDPVPLVATVLFYTPVVRDFISMFGVRQVRSAGGALLAHACRTLLFICAQTAVTLHGSNLQLWLLSLAPEGPRST